MEIPTVGNPVKYLVKYLSKRIAINWDPFEIPSGMPFETRGYPYKDPCEIHFIAYGHPSGSL